MIAFTLEGENARQLAEKLRGKPGVVFIAFFGALLHISGYDRDLLEAALAPFRNQPNIKVEQVTPSLEDVFIQLEQNNRGGKP